MNAPTGGEGVDEDQPTAVVLVGGRHDEGGAGPVGVGHLDTDDAPAGVVTEQQGEVPSGYAAVQYGVRGELGDHDRDRVVVVRTAGVPPLDQLQSGKQACESGSASGRGEALHEQARGGGRKGARGWHGPQPGVEVSPRGRHGADTDRLVLVHALDWESHCT